MIATKPMIFKSWAKIKQFNYGEFDPGSE